MGRTTPSVQTPLSDDWTTVERAELTRILTERDHWRDVADRLASAVLSLRAIAIRPVETPIVIIDRSVAQGDAAIEAWKESARV